MSKQRIIIAELDLSEYAKDFVPYGNGLWIKHMTVDSQAYKSSYFVQLYGAHDDEELNTRRYNIQSMFVGVKPLIKAVSIADCEAQNESFYFDISSHNLYVHYSKSYPSWIFDSYPSDTFGFCDHTRIGELDGAYWNDIYYEPRIMSDVSFKQNKDPLFFGIMSFDSLDIELNNADGYLDSFIDRPVFGQQFRIKIGYADSTYNQFKTMFTGFVDSFGYPNPNTFKLKVSDPRKALSVTLPQEKYLITEWPNLDENDNNKPKPLIYGSVRKIEAMCVDSKKANATSFTYCIGDTSKRAALSIGPVYDSEGKPLADKDGNLVAISNVNLANGTFTLPADGTNSYKAYVDVTMSGPSNALDVIKDMLDQYSDIEYIAANYDLASWASETTKAKTVGVLIDDATPMRDVIEDICNSTRGIFMILGDGRYSFRSYDPARAIAYAVQNDEIVGDIEVQYNSDEYLSSVRVLYGKDNATDEYLISENKTYETASFNRYRRVDQTDIETILTVKTQADEVAEQIMSISKDIAPTVSFTFADENKFDLMDFISLTVYREHHI